MDVYNNLIIGKQRKPKMNTTKKQMTEIIYVKNGVNYGCRVPGHLNYPQCIQILLGKHVGRSQFKRYIHTVDISPR